MGAERAPSRRGSATGGYSGSFATVAKKMPPLLTRRPAHRASHGRRPDEVLGVDLGQRGHDLALESARGRAAARRSKGVRPGSAGIGTYSPHRVPESHARVSLSRANRPGDLRRPAMWPILAPPRDVAPPSGHRATPCRARTPSVVAQRPPSHPAAAHRQHHPRAKGAEGSRLGRLVRPGGRGLPTLLRCHSARTTKRLRRAPAADLPRVRAGAPGARVGTAPARAHPCTHRPHRTATKPT